MNIGEKIVKKVWILAKYSAHESRFDVNSAHKLSDYMPLYMEKNHNTNLTDTYKAILTP